MSPEDVDRLAAQALFVAGVREGLADENVGRVVGHVELGRRLDARFGDPDPKAPDVDA